MVERYRIDSQRKIGRTSSNWRFLNLGISKIGLTLPNTGPKLGKLCLLAPSGGADKFLLAPPSESACDGLTMKPGKLQDTCKKEVGPGEFSGFPASSCPKPEGKLSLAAVLLFSVLLLYLAIVVKHSLSPQMTTVPDCGETTTQEISSHPIHGQGSLKITYCKGTPLLME